MSGEHAKSFAYAQGVSTFYDTLTEVPFLRWSNMRLSILNSHGTVAAVALDQNAKLASAISTGGWATAMPGRVGDVAIIGAGSYSDRQIAVCCTGNGEKF